MIFSNVFLSNFRDGGLKASEAKQKDGPFIPKKSGSGRMVSKLMRLLHS